MPLASLILRSGDSRDVHPFSGTVVVGRGATADISIPDTTVSRRHASLRLDGATVVIEDLGSANGTRLNGVRLHEPARAEDGDVITLGAVNLELHIDSRAPDFDPVATPTQILRTHA